MAHDEQPTRRRCAQDEMTFLVYGMVGILHQHGERVGEGGGRLIEGDLVLAAVGFGLVRIPLELVAHDSMVSHPTAEANTHSEEANPHKAMSDHLPR